MSVLFFESPFLATGVVILLGVSIIVKSTIAMGFCIVLLIFMLYFYRYQQTNIGVISDNVLVSPCEGTVLTILDKYDYYYVPIFLSPLNRHTQVYPCNCRVLKREYDRTGKFNIVMNLSKSANNEKKIHTMMMNNGAVLQMTQIAGFLPRMITSAEECGRYTAGEYFGMIKFGSRVDLLLPKTAPNGERLILGIRKGQQISLGEYLGGYL